MRKTIYLCAYGIGVVCALVAAFSGSVGPEPPQNPIVLFYGYLFFQPLLMMVDGPLGVIVGSLIAGLPFVGIAWLVMRVMPGRPD